MGFLSLLSANKTKILGVLIIIVSFVQQDDGLIELIGEVAYNWTIRFAGLLALIFGFLNNPPVSNTPEGQ